MRVGNFSLQIPEARERDSGHAEIPHGTVYAIRLGNHTGRQCDAEVVVDGKPVGGFRIDAFGSITLERPAHDTGRFTFYRAGTSEAAAAGEANVATDSRGLVQVTFQPERYRPPPVARSGGLRPMSVGPQYEVKTSGSLRHMAPAGAGGQMSYGGTTETCAAPGVTGLSGRSNQSFYNVSSLDYDPAEVVTITLRLVAVADGPRELTPADRGQANPVPSPLP
jgi:hypothetical protein